MLEILQLVAPGTVLRAGIERIIKAGKGAIIVLGYDKQIEEMRSGGFQLKAKLTAQHLSEVAKMDGAINTIEYFVHHEDVLRAQPDAPYRQLDAELEDALWERTEQFAGRLTNDVGAALTVGLNRGTALLGLLILPLAMPILIFGARTVSLAAAGDVVLLAPAAASLDMFVNYGARGDASIFRAHDEARKLDDLALRGGGADPGDGRVSSTVFQDAQDGRLCTNFSKKSS